MPKVSIFHNVSRDASFGLNSILKGGAKTDAPANATEPVELDGRWFWVEQATGDKRHPLVRVFQYEANCGPEAADGDLLNEAFEMFNIGHGPVTVEYRALRLRSLSVGDVVIINGRAFSCERLGWKRRDLTELLMLTSDQAEPAIRACYEILPEEPLSLTVPLPD
jgi:hypothetical protein